MEEVYIEREESILRIALREDGKLKECFIEEEKNEPAPGELYKGVVKNIVPAIKCAFVDIGYTKNAYMYIHHKFNNENVKNGDDLLIEVMKGSIGEKGPKITNEISVPGRYIVIVTYNNKVNFSKKIEDNDNFKEYINDNIKKPNDIGIMIRTNALDVDVEDINKEIESLYEKYKKIVKEGEHCIRPKKIYDGGGILGRMLNDILNSYTAKILVNNEDDYNYIKCFIKNKSDLYVDVEIYTGVQNLFNYYNIEREILSLRNKKVVLPSGGNIVIEKTEAMYVIDVNSGKNTKQSSLDKTVLQTNLEAANEIARQIMLRNLSGIIIIDFIDLDSYKNKKRIMGVLKEAFKDDKKKTIIYPFTQLNLVQIARKRRGKAIGDYIEEECKICHGKAQRIKLTYLSKLIKNDIIKISMEFDIKDIYIEIDEIYEKDILGDVLNFVEKINALDKKVYINFVTNLEYFKVEPLMFGSQIKKLENLKIYG